MLEVSIERIDMFVEGDLVVTLTHGALRIGVTSVGGAGPRPLSSKAQCPLTERLCIVQARDVGVGVLIGQSIEVEVRPRDGSTIRHQASGSKVTPLLASIAYIVGIPRETTLGSGLEALLKVNVRRSVLTLVGLVGHAREEA